MSSSPALPTVHLVDASPYIFRAYFAVPPTLRDPSGRSVNAVQGFTHFLLRLVEIEQPTHLGVAFDESLGSSYRNDDYPAYKSSRPSPPPELEAQLDDCQEVTRALGIASWSCERFEADDIIATVATPLVDAGHSVVVVSSDKDLCQLVGDRLSLFDFAANKRFGSDEVVTKLGVRPHQVADFLGLAGDSVDDIPGVPGIGAKTAAALLSAYPDMEHLYADLAGVGYLKIRGARSVQDKLAKHREQAFLSRSLATTSVEAPVDPSLEDLAYHGADRSAVDPLFERLGFDTLYQRISRWR